MYCEKTLRRKAKNIGYVISKGYMRTLAAPNAISDSATGYTIYKTIDNRKELFAVYGCNDVYYNLASLEEVEAFLREAYNDMELNF